MKHVEEKYWVRIQGRTRKGWIYPPHARSRNIIAPYIYLLLLRRLLILCYSKLVILMLVPRLWFCVVGWSRRLPTFTICKRSILECVHCPILPHSKPAIKRWLFTERNAWSHVTLLVRLKSCLLFYTRKLSGIQIPHRKCSLKIL